MITSKAIPICRSAFQGEYLVSSSPKSVGALGSSSSPKRKSGYGMVTMAYTGGSVKDPYSTLGVSPGATKHEIKKAYRRLALQYHPDVCDGNHCTTSFQQINHAYEVLLSLSLELSEFSKSVSTGVRLALLLVVFSSLTVSTVNRLKKRYVLWGTVSDLVCILRVPAVASELVNPSIRGVWGRLVGQSRRIRRSKRWFLGGLGGVDGVGRRRHPGLLQSCQLRYLSVCIPRHLLWLSCNYRLYNDERFLQLRMEWLGFKVCK